MALYYKERAESRPDKGVDRHTDGHTDMELESGWTDKITERRK